MGTARTRCASLSASPAVAAYKAAELVRRLQQERFSVGRHDARGMRFIKPLTFAALTGKK